MSLASAPSAASTAVAGQARRCAHAAGPARHAPVGHRAAAARRAAGVARAADADAEKLAALQQAMESNPEVATKMKQMEEEFMKRMAALREDPELKEVFEEFLAKIGEKMGDLSDVVDTGAPAAAAAPPPVVNNAVEDYCAIGKGGLTDDEGRGALHYAVAYNQLDAVHALLANGAAVDATERNGNTAAHYAAGYGRGDCLRALLAAGADVGVKNAQGQTAADVVKGEPRNPLNGDEALMAVLEGKQPAASLA
eukprot:scaffold20.g7800.t1